MSPATIAAGELRQDAASISADLIHLRRELHREPELGLQLPRTQEKVLAALDGLPLEITLGTSLTSVTAVLRGSHPDAAERAVLLRADMDALPVAEKTGLDYASVNGAMHACGHDLHTAMLVGAARLLSSQREKLRGDVVLMFQPGEEGDDGARHMIQEGVLDAPGRRVDAAYALHVLSAVLPRGLFATRRGPVLAASDTVRVTVNGTGGHGSAPHLAADPVSAACAMVTGLHTFVSRRFDPFDPVVLTVGSIHGGTQHNVIPDQVRFDATVRSFSAHHQALLKDGFVEVCRGIAAGHGVQVEVDYQPCYPVTINDVNEAEFVAASVAETLGDERILWAPNPGTGSEDFSRVLDQVPGAYLALGAPSAGADPSKTAYNHSPDAAFDDSVLADGAAIYASLAARRLEIVND